MALEENKFDEVIVSAEVVDSEDKRTENNVVALNKVYGGEMTICMAVGLVLNVGLLLFSHIGLSATIFSSVCPQSICEESVTAPPVVVLVDECLGDGDLAVFGEGQPGEVNLAQDLRQFGLACAISPKQCVVDRYLEKYETLSESCAQCLGNQFDCSRNECVSDCFGATDSPECQACSQENCIPKLRTCTGLPLGELLNEPPTRRLQSSFDCFDRSEVELFKVFNLTFINSVQEAIEGGSIALALLIIVASGIWPYLKNILMAIAWFCPLSTAKREMILFVLGVLGKWSLVDVFAVVLIINGVRLEKIFSEESVLVVFAESRIAIYAFGIAAIWALLQGELIRYKERDRLKNNRAVAIIEETFGLKCIRMLLGFTAIGSGSFAILGLFFSSIGFTLSGLITSFEGSNEFEFAAHDLSLAMVDECAIYEGRSSVAGSYFLAGLFLVMVIGIPLLSCILFILVSVSPLSAATLSRGYFARFAFGLSNFAALDVFLLSLLTVASQFEDLLAAAIGDAVDEECGVEPGQECLVFRGEIDQGVYFFGVSVILFWASQICFRQLLLRCS